ncbi:MAG: hypothetical protein LBS85_02960 [Clostridiales Family XIII bacterium]|nr:hypothetical protein [Clostridiales Family XIII bacterium]
MKMKQIAKKLMALTLGAVFFLSFGALGVSALEVPGGVTEVSIPISIAASGAIAGGEIEFSQTSGLKYVRFVPAAGVENKIETNVAGKSYVGFFAESNNYSPKDGKVAVGNLVFGYSGSAPESITFSEVRVHTKTAEGVDSKTTKSNQVVTLTRAAADTGTSTDPGKSGESGDPGDGSGGGKSGVDSNSNNNNNSGDPNENGGAVETPGITLPADGNGGNTENNIVVTAAATGGNAAEEAATAEAGEAAAGAANSGASSGANGGTGSDGGQVADNPVPLASADAGGTTGFPAWLWAIVIAIAAAIVIFFLYFFYYKKRQKKEAVSQS